MNSPLQPIHESAHRPAHGQTQHPAHSHSDSPPTTLAQNNPPASAHPNSDNLLFETIFSTNFTPAKNSVDQPPVPRLVHKDARATIKTQPLTTERLSTRNPAPHPLKSATSESISPSTLMPCPSPSRSSSTMKILRPQAVTTPQKIRTISSLHAAWRQFMVSAGRFSRRPSHPRNEGWGMLEWSAVAFLMLGVGVFSLGAYHVALRQHTMTTATTPAPSPASPTEASENLGSKLAANLISIPAASATVSPQSSLAPINENAVFPYTWQKLVNRLEQKQYTISFSQALHPRLYLIELARGVELNLLLSPDERTVEEINVRVHTLEAVNPLATYRQLMVDLQGLVGDGVLADDTQYFTQLNLPHNLYSVPLPYAVAHQTEALRVELQILDPIYINLRFLPLRAKTDGTHFARTN